MLNSSLSMASLASASMPKAAVQHYMEDSATKKLKSIKKIEQASQGQKNKSLKHSPSIKAMPMPSKGSGNKIKLGSPVA